MSFYLFYITIQDINECSSNNGGCDLHATCVNTPGGFRCVCDNGFSGDGFNCTDINECLDEPNLCENGACINTDGSFSCDCQKGFMHPAEEYSQVCNIPWQTNYSFLLHFDKTLNNI